MTTPTSKPLARASRAASPPQAHDGSAGPASARTLAIPVQQPFPWQTMLASLASRLAPGSEQIAGACYVRLTPAGRPAATVSFNAHLGRLEVMLGEGIDPRDTAARIARLFSPDVDTGAHAALSADALLGPRISAVPGLRPLGGWDPFELCLRTLVGQQVTVKAAQRLIERLTERCVALEPERIATANLERIGMPGRRVAAIQAFAEAVCDGRIDLEARWTELAPVLAALPGFGPWTCSYLGIRLGRDPDAFPASDAGLLRASAADGPRELARLAERWRPYRALAATYLWMVPAGAGTESAG